MLALPTAMENSFSWNSRSATPFALRICRHLPMPRSMHRPRPSTWRARSATRSRAATLRQPPSRTQERGSSNGYRPSRTSPEWEPSQQVRIKLVAPSFPKRVLSTVKWLEDAYEMPIEAIQVQLYDVDDGNTQHLAFERLLPIPTTNQYVTIREARPRPIVRSGVSRRPDVIRTLLEAGVIEHGTSLWFLKRSHEFPAAMRADTPDDQELFEVVLDASGPKLRSSSGRTRPRRCTS